MTKEELENVGDERLADGHAAGPGDAAGESRVHSLDRIHDAEAVRADDTHASVAGRSQHFRFQRGTVFTHFFESRRDDDGTFNTAGHTFAHNFRDRRSGGDQNGQIHRFGD